MCYLDSCGADLLCLNAVHGLRVHQLPAVASRLACSGRVVINIAADRVKFPRPSPGDSPYLIQVNRYKLVQHHIVL